MENLRLPLKPNFSMGGIAKRHGFGVAAAAEGSLAVDLFGHFFTSLIGIGEGVFADDFQRAFFIN